MGDERELNMVPLTVAPDVPQHIMDKLRFDGTFDREKYAYIIGKGYVSPPDDPDDRHLLRNELESITEEHIVGKPIYREHDYRMPIGSVFSHHIDKEAGVVWIGAMLHNSGDGRKRVVEQVRNGELRGLSLGLLISNEKTNARANKRCFEFSMCKEGAVPGCEILCVYSKNPTNETMSSQESASEAQPAPAQSANGESAAPRVRKFDARAVYNEIFNEIEDGDDKTKTEGEGASAAALPPPPQPKKDAPVKNDGDRTNSTHDNLMQVIEETTQERRRNMKRNHSAMSHSSRNLAELLDIVPEEYKSLVLSCAENVGELERMLQMLKDREMRSHEEYVNGQRGPFKRHTQLFSELGLAGKSRDDPLLQSYWNFIVNPDNRTVYTINDKLVNELEGARKREASLQQKIEKFEEKHSQLKKRMADKLQQIEQNWSSSQFSGNSASKKARGNDFQPPEIAAYSKGGPRTISFMDVFNATMEDDTPSASSPQTTQAPAEDAPSSSASAPKKRTKEEAEDPWMLNVREQMMHHPNFRNGRNAAHIDAMRDFGKSGYMMANPQTVCRGYGNTGYTCDVANRIDATSSIPALKQMESLVQKFNNELAP